MNQEKLIVPAETNQYPGEWVALHPKTRKVIAHHVKLNKVVVEAEEQGIQNAVFHGVPKAGFHRHYRVIG